MFTKETYVRRRDKLVEKMTGQKGIIIFIGNVNAPAQYRDNCYKFRQDSNFLYFFGIDAPGFSASIDLESGVQTIYADDFSLDDIIWSGPMPSVAFQADEIGIRHTAPSGKLSWIVSDALIKGRPIHFLPATRYYQALRLSSLLGLDPQETFNQGKSGCPKASLALVKAVIEMRLVKEACEIEAIDEACILGQEMHTVARKNIQVGKIEQDVVAAMEAVAIKKGWGISFPTILTQHGEVFHCHSHALPIEDGKLMVVDAGVESNAHYASDFTRTYPTGGKFSTRQREIYQIVSDAHDLAFSLSAPGVTYLSIHLAVEKKILEGLHSLGLVCGDLDDAVNEGIAGLFLPHGLGHNMGIDVHDMEDLGEDLVGYDPDQTRSALLGRASLRMARRLQSGNVITDEPGMYFIPALISKWKEEGKGKEFLNYSRLESYFDFGGIRLEDDVLITETGARRLGGNRLPGTPDEIEEAMKND